MPLYEYQCRSCGYQFEALVRDSSTPPCPRCQGEEVERLVSMFAVSSDATRTASVRSERKASTTKARDKAIAEHELTRHHHH